VALTSCAALLGIGAARAQTPTEFWHQEWARQHRASVQQDYPDYQPRGWSGGEGYGSPENWTGDQNQNPRGPMPQVRVSNPTFYEYKPDVLKRVSLDKLCAPAAAPVQPPQPHPQAETTGAAVPETTGASVADQPPSPFVQACSGLSSDSMRMPPEVSAALTAWYGAHPQFVWSDGNGVSAKALAAIATLNASDKVGLEPADYRVDAPSLDGRDDAARQAALLRFDLTLSAKTLSYVLDATRGRSDPDRISGYHDLPRKNVDLAAAMTAMAQQDDVAQWMQAQNPDNAQFRALVAELSRLRASATKQTVQLPDDIRIMPGETNPRLGDVLAAIGQDEPALKQKYSDVFGQARGKYDQAAVAAVKAFQRDKGLTADGAIGRNTIRALMRRGNAAGKIEKVEAALERLRWLPRDFGKRYVFLNQPAFEVTFVNGTDKPLSMRAVVGRPDAQTYFFVDHIKDVQFNPYWNVPRSIVINEMLPKLYRDGSYLDDHGYEVLNTRGRQIASNSVNWAGFAKNTVGVEVRQPPGRRNALGLLKIEFPNKHAIYMHDTPEKAFFTRDMRALSHGCVRLQHPKEMAAALLGKSVDYVRKQIGRGENATERVGGDTPVYLAYFTAWPDQNGAVRYYADVYDRDAHLKTALEKTEAARKGG
jgi:murein L,D-transpeptidase YcbB/YkuD